MRKNISSGAPWEDIVGYSRAVQIGNTIEISGCAPVKNGQPVYGSAYEQARCCLEVIKETLTKAGASLQDVVRTRMFVTDISQWEEFGRAHGEYFADIKPATSMVEVSRLIDPDFLIEIEATAIIEEN
jgi:enamine deaminase RidA (YjgF/YER057c/UK114 family)